MIILGKVRDLDPKRRLKAPEVMRCIKCGKVLNHVKCYVIRFSRKGDGPWCIICGVRQTGPGLHVVETGAAHPPAGNPRSAKRIRKDLGLPF